MSKKLVAFLSAVALTAAGPAVAQAVPQPAPLSVGSEASALQGEDGFGWAMGGLVIAATLVVLALIFIDDDDSGSP